MAKHKNKKNHSRPPAQKQTPAPAKRAGDDRMFQVIRKNESVTRADISTWKNALLEAGRAENARQVRLQTLYDRIANDALLSSQIELRIDRTQSADFVLVDEHGKEDEAATLFARDNAVYDSLVAIIIESKMYGCSVVEFTFDSRGRLVPSVIPRRHIAPSDGIFYPDTSDEKGIRYRELPDFGRFILEFNYNSGTNYGLLNKAVPHVLMKSFSQMCWSELCEIYGIPPRVMYTDTTSPVQLARAENMMKHIGAAAWFIMDTTEKFEFAANMSQTNGDVYNNLMQFCNNEISLLITGAVLGQDTVNGNRSKEESSRKLTDSVVLADQRNIEMQFNHAVLPALASLGLMREGLRLNIRKETDIHSLWDMTHQAAGYFEIDPAWVKDTFGIEVTGPRTSGFGPEPGPARLRLPGGEPNPFV
jgi:phage gp29-like protein